MVTEHTLNTSAKQEKHDHESDSVDQDLLSEDERDKSRKRPPPTSQRYRIGSMTWAFQPSLDDEKATVLRPEDYWKRCQELPRWAKTKEVTEVCRQHREHHKPGPLPLSFTCGPAVLHAIFCATIQAVYFAMFMPVMFEVGQCDDDGYAVAPLWKFTLLMPLCVVQIILELLCHRYSTVPKFQVVGNFSLPRPLHRVHIGANIWLALVSTRSVMNLVNHANIGVFTGMLHRAANCRGNAKIREVWHEVMLQSTFCVGLAPDLVAIASVAWLLTFTPLIFSVLYALPVPSEFRKIKYKVVQYDKYDKNDKEPPCQGDYEALLDSEMNHGKALLVLGEATGMVGVVDCGLKYAQLKAKQELEKTDRDWKKYLNHAIGQVNRAIVKTFFQGALINAFQLNLQVTVLSTRRAVASLHGRAHVPEEWQALVVLFISFAAVISIIGDGVKTLAFAKEVAGEFDKRGPKEAFLEKANGKQEIGTEALSQQTRNTEKDEEKAKQDKTEQNKKEKREQAERRFHHKVNKHMCRLAALTLFCAIWVLYAVVKLAMSFVCSNAIWNMDGCVDLSGVSFSAAPAVPQLHMAHRLSETP